MRVGLRLDAREVDWAHVEHWLLQSWRRAAPARLLRLVGDD